MKELELLKNSVITKLSKENQTEKYLLYNKKYYTRKEIIFEIKNNSELGNLFIKDLVILSLDLFERNKEDLKNFKK